MTAPSGACEHRAMDDEKRAYNREQALRRERQRIGFTPELVEQLRDLQRGCCALCYVKLTHGGNSAVSEHADHCHASGLARGLLCAVCNLALGQYERHQAPRGMYIAIYERYLAHPPANMVDSALPVAETLEWL